MSDNQQASKPPVSRGLVFAIVIVAILLVCVLVFIVGAVARSAGGHHASPATHTASPTNSSSETAADKSVCGLPGFAASGTLDSAPPTKWVLVGTVAAPTERTTVGPGVVKGDGFRSCYEHTPTGALFAAANLLALDSDQSLLKEVAENLIAPGPGRTALMAQSSTPPDATTRYQIAGFNIDSYARSTATVDLAINTSTGDLVSFPIQMQWVGGDWKAKTTSTGGFPLQPASLADLGGYTPWSGA
jgi:hypothetical protein